MFIFPLLWMFNKVTKLANIPKFCSKRRFSRREQRGSGAGLWAGPGPSELRPPLPPQRSLARSRPRPERLCPLSREPRPFSPSRTPARWWELGPGREGMGRDGWDQEQDRDPAPAAPRSRDGMGLRSSGGWWGGAAASPQRTEAVRGSRSAMAPGCAGPGAGAGFSWRSLPASLTAALPLPRSLPG